MLRTLAAGLALLAYTSAAGCAGRPAPLPGVAGRLGPAVFAPGPSADRFASEDGPVTRTRTAIDGDGVWTSTTEGPGERSVLTLVRAPDGGVLLRSLVSGDRDVVCEPGLVIEPGDGVLPHRAETACTIDGRAGTAEATLTMADAGGGADAATDRLALTLTFRASPVVATRRFEWRRGPGGLIEAEQAELRVTVLGVPVRGWSRTMTREP